jgi:acyl-CoA synthetase (AMP-forming)/AMP-acid ligase II
MDRLRCLTVHRGDQRAAFDAEGALTYRELVAGMDAVAAGLRTAGVGPGDTVGTAMEPSLAYLLVVLGAMQAGAVTAVLNTRLTPIELRRYLAPIDPVVVITDSAYDSLARDLGRPTLKLSSALDAAPLAERVSPLYRAPMVDGEVSEGADALIFPTGGTTGTPKGGVYDHRGSWVWFNSAIQSEPDRRTGTELFCSPFFHVTFGVGVLARLFAGDTVHILHKFDADDVLAAIGGGAHRVIGATTMFKTLRERPAFNETPRAHLRRIQFGASPATPQFIQQLLEDYPAARVRSAYGSTECGPVTGMEHEELVGGRVEGVGVPLPGAVLRIFDEHGNELPQGEEGEIRVRSPWATNGYYNLPEETAATFGPDGIRTGDVGWFAPDGWLHLSGRSKEMIITGGENVFPNEVESVLLEHPRVRELIVYGVADAHWGERVEVGVVPQPGGTVDLEDLRAFGRRSLAGYKLPKTMRVLETIPLTGAHKPDRNAARRLAEDSPEPAAAELGAPNSESPGPREPSVDTSR